ncbi:aquaporin-like [Battus philenor]|uniref:aquaporin-like n=1 Tax=Battus philenor TaxID=42288 RepID=UPI0035CFFD23
MAHLQQPAAAARPVHLVESCGSKQCVYAESEAEEQYLCSVCACGAGRGVRGSRAELWRAAAAEAVCTALLVLLTCLPGSADAPLLQRALASGLLVAALVQCFDQVSGAMMNPAVTLAATVAGRVGAARGAALAAAQAAGALAGGAALQALRPGAAAACCTRPAPALPHAQFQSLFVSYCIVSERVVLQAACVEALLGAVLALVNCAAWDARNRRLLDSWPLRVGLTVAALTLAAGDLTGASINPARSLAPALFSGDWNAQWVYCVGPLCGALCGAVLYRCVWRAPPSAPARGLDPAPRVAPRPGQSK